MSNSINGGGNNNLEDYEENGLDVLGVGVPPQNHENAPEPIPVDAVSCDAQNVDISSHTNRSMHQGDQQKAQKTPAREEQEHGNTRDGSPSQVGTGEIKQQRVGSRPRHRKDALGTHEEDRIGREEDRSQRQEGRDLQVQGRPNSGRTPDPERYGFKEVHTEVVPIERSPKPIPKKFRIPDLPKYNGTSEPNEHVTAYTCAVKCNELKDDEIESILLKKFGETLFKGARMWYHNLAPNAIDSFAMLADSFIKVHAGEIKVATRKSDIFNNKQRDNEMLREFVSRFQME
ncbi:uncharacterized protein [Nicotiana sylvestris]|uniref:uncharacterized protein n=1 Tax=Nicotiana sylvestris TaxID=4096 RepID=UPI00388C9CE7